MFRTRLRDPQWWPAWPASVGVPAPHNGPKVGHVPPPGMRVMFHWCGFHFLLLLTSHINTKSSLFFCSKEPQSSALIKSFSSHQLTFFGLSNIKIPRLLPPFPLEKLCLSLSFWGWKAQAQKDINEEIWHRAGIFAWQRRRLSQSFGAFGWVKGRRDGNKPRATSS